MHRALRMAILWLTLALSPVVFGQNLKVMSYNVWGLPVPIKLNHKHLPLIAQSVHYFGADVIAFQETFTKKARVLAQIESYPHRAWGPKKKGLRISSGLLTISKHPIVKTKHMLYRACSGTDCVSRKGVLMTRIDVPGIGEVDVYNTHLNAGKNKRVKGRQLKALRNFIEETSFGRPVVVMGDFNLTPDSSHHEYILDAINLVDTHQEYVDSTPGLPMYEYLGHTHEKKKLLSKKRIRRKLDYIFYKNEGETELEVVSSKVTYDGVKGIRRLSDHFAVLVDLRKK